MIMFNAALEALYAYQPPNRLSEILPTLAESAVKIVGDFLLSLGMKCLAINDGAMVLISYTYK